MTTQAYTGDETHTHDTSALQQKCSHCIILPDLITWIKYYSLVPINANINSEF